MAIEIKQSLRLSQQLVVTPQLQQAIKLLQLSRMELSQMIQKELTENPILEEGTESSNAEEAGEEETSNGERTETAKEEDKGHDHTTDEVVGHDGTLKEPANFDWENYSDIYNTPYPASTTRPPNDLPPFENMIAETESLHDHLIWQIHLSTFVPDEMAIANDIIGNINDDGYLMVSVDEIAVKCNELPERVETVLKKIQQLDPPGVAARTLTECLLLQARQLESSEPLLERIITEFLHDLETHNYPHIARKLKTDVERIRKIAAFIHSLEPKPGRPYSTERTQYITPDVYVHKLGGDYVVVLNEDGLPKLQISNFYKRTLQNGNGSSSQTKEYVQNKLRAAMWLIKSIHQRQRTLYRVTKSIVKFQHDFFVKGFDHLKPMILRDVAEDIGMHESTVSRVTTSKFVHTPRGIFELKFFFNSMVPQTDGGDGIAAESVKRTIQQLIESESPQKPLSDQDLAEHLKAKNITIARRTIAKYREGLGIGPSSKRRRYE